MSTPRRHAAAAGRVWTPFVLVAAVWAVVATHQIGLPGIYSDAINPDYLVARILNPSPEPSMVWVLVGNSLLGDRAPVLISPYHGSQQFWLGLPLYAMFGTTVAGVRLTHAAFALGVLAALYALLLRCGVRPWLAAATGAALALDPSFSYSFRTQAFITVAPAAWLLLSLLCLFRASEPGAANPGRWWFGSGALGGLAAVGYFVWGFVLPPIAVAAWRANRASELARPPWLAWAAGLATGAMFYPIGYLLVARKLGSVAAIVDFLHEQRSTLGVFSSPLSPEGRASYAWHTIDAVVSDAWHNAMMMGGDLVPTAGSSWKTALVVGLPYLLWLVAEFRGRATPMQRMLVALPLSFVAFALVFGDRLGGHHFATLVPLLYAALGAGLAPLLSSGDGRAAVLVAAPLAALAVLNLGGQFELSDRLAQTRGKGLLSDAIHRFAADLNAMPEKPYLWFPEPALALPLIMLTRASVPMSDQIDDPGPRRALCAGRDVAMVRIDGHASAPRARQWQANLAWDAPKATPYAQADGRVVFEVDTFHGRRDGPGCQAGAPSSNGGIIAPQQGAKTVAAGTIPEERP